MGCLMGEEICEEFVILNSLFAFKYLNKLSSLITVVICKFSVFIIRVIVLVFFIREEPLCGTE